MGKNESIFIIGGIVAGVAVTGSLFLLYPDLMFKNTSFQAQQSGAPPVIGGSPATTTTAGVGTNNTTNSTVGNTTAGAPGSTSPLPPTGPPSY